MKCQLSFIAMAASLALLQAETAEAVSLRAVGTAAACTGALCIIPGIIAGAYIGQNLAETGYLI